MEAHSILVLRIARRSPYFIVSFKLQLTCLQLQLPGYCVEEAKLLLLNLDCYTCMEENGLAVASRIWNTYIYIEVEGLKEERIRRRSLSDATK